MLKTLRQCAAAAAIILLSAGSARAQNENVGINTTGAAPHVSAMLDVDVAGLPHLGKRGMLVPRMTEAERAAIVGPVQGLLVFQTNDGIGRHGLWYHTGVVWQRLSDGPGWRLPGNALTISGTHYLGTPDAQPLVVRTNNMERMRFTAGAGLAPIGIGTAAPTEALEVDGGVRTFSALFANNASNAIGGIRYNTAPPAGYPQVHEGNIDGTAAGWKRLENAERRVIGAPYTGSLIQCAAGDATSVQTGVTVQWFDTPFPTQNNNGGIAVSRNWRVQYVFRAAELLSYGLCAGNITNLMFFMTEDDDQNSPAAINFVVRIAHTGHTQFAGATPNWDNTITAQPIRYGQCTYVVGSGQLNMLLNAPFNWDGTNNIMIDLRYDRGNVGFNPKCQIQAMTYPCTRYAIGNMGPANACTDPYTVGISANSLVDASSAFTAAGNSNNRPVVRFIGQAQTTVPTPAVGNYTHYDGGLVVGTWGSLATPPVLPAGTFKGPGTIHADTAVYDGNAQLSDHVFDRYFDGQVRPEDAAVAANYNYVPLRELKTYLEGNRHLPSMPSRTEWETQGSLSLGAMATRLWETVETQALYITELERDLRVLEELAYKERMTEEELEALVARVHRNPRLTADQKAHLAAALRERFQDSQRR